MYAGSHCEDLNGRLNRLSAALGEVHRAVLDVHERETLFQRICNVLVETGGLQSAWISSGDDPQTPSIPSAAFPIPSSALTLFLHSDDAGFFGAAETKLIEGVAVSISLALNRIEEEERRQEHRMFETILEHTLAGYWDWRIEGDDGSLSPGSKRVLGHEEYELVPEDRPLLREAFDRHVKSRGEIPYYVEVRYRHKDSSMVWVACSGKVIEWNAAGEAVRAIGCHVDISVRKQTEEPLSSSEMLYRTLFESADDAILLHRAEGPFVAANPAALECLGYTEVEMLRMRPVDIVAPESRAIFDRMVAALQTDNRAVAELNHLSKDGRRIPVEIKATRLPIAGETLTLCVARNLSDRKRVEEALRQSEERNSGELNFMSGTELDWLYAKLEQQLQRAQKLESVGRLAGGVAHDFNNLLTVINGYGDLALRSLKDGDPVKRHVEQMRQAGEHAASLTSQLLAFSRRQAAEPRVLNLNDLIHESRNLLRHMLGEAIELALQLAPGLGRVTADPGQMHRVLMNLAVNARDAMTGGGRVTIRTENCEIDEPAAAGADVKPGSYVSISVSDTGCGMDESVLARAFEPFFTTKAQGKGTGLGLSTVNGIARQGGGWVSAKSEPGAGTSIRIYLPRVAPEPARADVAVDPQPRKERGTILIVEDQPEVRHLAVIVLGNIGYETIEAAGGAEALSVVERATQEIDLVLTDIVMPRMSGWELADRIGRIRPQLKVLFMSGYTGEASADEKPLDPTTEFLAKPFSPEQLADKVKSILQVNRPR